MAGHGSTRHGCSGTWFPWGTLSLGLAPTLAFALAFPLPGTLFPDHMWLPITREVPGSKDIFPREPPCPCQSVPPSSVASYHSHTFPPSMCQCLQVKSVGPMECQLNEEGPLSWRT